MLEDILSSENIQVPDECVTIDGVTYTMNMKKIVAVDRNITELIIPETVEELEEELCFGHDKLTLVKISESIKKIPRSCFANCHELVQVHWGEVGLEEICSFAFNGCEKLDGILLPSTVKELGYYCFGECKSLSWINIPSLVTQLPDRSFAGCESLKTIDWMYWSEDVHVENIGAYSFDGCMSLESVTIPKSVKIVGVGAFNGCNSIKRFNSESPFFDVINGIVCYTDIYSGVRCIIHQITNSSVLELPGDIVWTDCAFAKNDQIETAIIPENITYIPNRAFYKCKNLKKVIFKGDVIHIGEEAFGWCENLEELTIPRSIVFIENGAFMFCKNIKKLVIPSNIKKIGYEVFGGCDIEDLTIEEGVEVISSCAFGWNKNIKRVVLPGSIKEIHDSAFLHCQKLEEIIIPESCKTIANNIFESCYSLKRIIIPKGSKRFYTNLLTNCEDLFVEDENRPIGNEDPITIVCPVRKSLSTYDKLCDKKEQSLPHRNAVQRVIVPEGVVSLGNELFKDCVSLESVELPESLEYIGDETFRGCISLKTIRMPSHMKSIGRFTFAGCVELRSIYMPEGVTKVPKYSHSFEECHSLENVSLPSTFCNWKKNIFQKCTNIKNIESDHFVCCNGAIYTKDMKKLCAYVSSQKTFVVPDGVQVISEQAFRGSNIEEVTFPRSLITIQSFAFGECSKLSKVNFSIGLKNIESMVFESCRNLKELIIPEGVKRLGSHAISLYDATIVIPSTIKVWEESGRSDSNCKYYVPKDKVEYYKEFIAHNESVFGIVSYDGFTVDSIENLATSDIMVN